MTDRGPLARAAILVEEAPHSFDPVITRMSHLADLSQQELALLRVMARFRRNHPAQTELCKSGETRVPRVIIEGWAAQQRTLSNGRRQIIRFLLPGDVVGSLSSPKARSPLAVWTLTPVVVGSTEPLLRALESEPDGGLAAAVREVGYADMEGVYDHIIRLGSYPSYERMIHLILELYTRLKLAGQVEGNSFSWPLSQEMLAQALGLSVVHVNRVLQEIRRDGLLELRGSQVRLLNLGQMDRVADLQRRQA